MKPSLEQSALKLFEQVCQTQGMDNNILFSPYSLQQALSLLFVNKALKISPNEERLINNKKFIEKFI